MGQASPPAGGRRVFSFREGWKVRGRELNALYDVLGPAIGKRNGDPVEDLRLLVAERDRLRRFAAWVADHRLVEGVYADTEHPYSEWVTSDDEEAEFEDVVERAKEALGELSAGGAVGPEQAQNDTSQTTSSVPAGLTPSPADESAADLLCGFRVQGRRCLLPLSHEGAHDLSSAGGEVDSEQADVAVLPEAVSGAEVERLRAIERAAIRACEAEFTSERLKAMDALRAALSEGERHE